jgi:hypothetical protein
MFSGAVRLTGLRLVNQLLTSRPFTPFGGAAGKVARVSAATLF